MTRPETTDVPAYVDDMPTRAPDGEVGQFYFWLGSDAEVADLDDDPDGTEAGA